MAVCLAFMPFAASAAGLGKLTVISSLGQPLNAEIELLSATKDELSSMSAHIAPSSAYAEQGLERASILSAVRVELSSRPDGMPVLKITSPQSVNDPFLDMLVQVDWSSGSLLREYTALLDPPGFGDQPAAVAVASPVAQDQATATIDKPASATRPSTEKKSKSHKPAMQKAATSVAQASAPATGEGLTTKRGDTLGGIAGQMPPVEGVSLEQMLVGVYRANKEAFSGGNMNRLKVGQIMRQPSAEELQAISQQDAAKEIRVQTADWNAYRNKLASAVAESTPLKEEAPRQAASGKITAPAEDKGAAASTGPHDVVKLSKGDTTPEQAGGAAAKGAAATKSAKGDTQNKTGALQEEVTAREKAIKEANDRVALLEKQVQELKQLLEMKNQTLADLQKGAAAKPAEPAKPVVPVPAKVELAVPVATPAAVEVKAEAVKPDVAKTEDEKPKHKPKKIVKAPVAEESLLDALLGGLMGNLPLLGGLLAALGGVGWLAARRQRKPGVDKPEPAVSAASGLSPAEAASAKADAGDTSFLTDFSQSTGGGMIDTNDVDPISEAEVYMAYGRDAQAEEILKDAIKKSPKRYELHLKLLEIYVNRKDSTAFEILAGELYNEPGTADPVWGKVAELGRRIAPGNPRYSEQSAESSASEASDQEAPALDMEATQIFEAEPAADEALPDIAAEATLDFSLDAGNADEAPAVTDGHSLDFDMGALDGADEVAELEMPPGEVEVPALGVLADLNVVDSAASDTLPEIALELPADETAGFDFALDLPEPAAAENIQLDATDLGVDVLPEIGLPELEEAKLEAPGIDTPEIEVAGLEEEVAAAKPAKKPRARKSKKAVEDEVIEAPAAEETITPDEPGMGIEILPELEEAATDNVTDDMALELPVMSADEAVEDIGMDELAAEPDASSSELELVLPAFDEPVVEESTVEAEPAAEEISLPSDETELVVEELPFELPEVEEPAFDFEKTMIMQAPPAQKAAATETVVEDETIVLDAGASAAGGELDSDKDIETAQAKAAPEVDFSGIDLDLGASGASAAEATVEEEITLSAGAESADVDTKLDLVTAYLDMGDKEGARELLQEVLDEGGPQQRERAQGMMDALD